MFKLIVQTSLRNRLFVLAVAAALVGYGIFVLPSISVDVFPDLNRPTVNILTEAEGLAPQEVEQLVTFPIETLDERHARRHPRALGFRRRAVGGLRRVRLGHRYLSRTGSSSPSGWR